MPGDVVGFPDNDKPEDHFIEFHCPECESEHFKMVGMNIDGEDSDIIKLECGNCGCDISGYFVWLDELEE